MAPAYVNLLVGVVVVVFVADALNRLRREFGVVGLRASPPALLFGVLLLALSAVGSLYAVRGLQGVDASLRLRLLLLVLVLAVTVTNYVVGRS